MTYHLGHMDKNIEQFFPGNQRSEPCMVASSVKKSMLPARLVVVLPDNWKKYGWGNLLTNILIPFFRLIFVYTSNTFKKNKEFRIKGSTSAVLSTFIVNPFAEKPITAYRWRGQLRPDYLLHIKLSPQNMPGLQLLIAAFTPYFAWRKYRLQSLRLNQGLASLLAVGEATRLSANC